MSKTLRYLAIPAFFSAPSYVSASSQTDSELADVKTLFSETESLGANIVREFVNTFLDSRQENWDGNGALPVSEASYLRAKGFLEKCIEKYPAPMFGVTPGGSLTFDWFVNPSRRLIVSIDEDAQIAYSSMFGASSVHHGAVTYLDEVPSIIWAHLGALYPR